MAFQLLDLILGELSLVDSPANPFAEILLSKGIKVPGTEQLDPDVFPTRACPSCGKEGLQLAASFDTDVPDALKCAPCGAMFARGNNGKLVALEPGQSLADVERRYLADTTRDIKAFADEMRGGLQKLHQDTDELGKSVAALQRDENNSEDAMDVQDISKRAERGLATPQEIQKALTLEIEKLLPTALQEQQQNHPELPLAEKAKRAKVAALDAVHQMFPGLSRPGSSPEAVAKRADLITERDAVEATIEAMAAPFISKDCTPQQAYTKALGTHAGLQAYREYARLNEKIRSLQ